MTINEIIQLDCREEESREIIQKELKKIKPLSKYSEGDIPLEKIEKLIAVLCNKYKMRVSEVMPDIWSSKGNIIWASNIIDENSLMLMNQVYGVSIYEVLTKTALLMYHKREEVGRKSE